MGKHSARSRGDWVAVHCSGFLRATTGGINLGDAAQPAYALKVLQGKGERPIVLANPGPTSGDEVALRALAAPLGLDTPIMRSNRPEVVKGWLGQAELAIGVANHFLVFAASARVPCMGIHTTPYMRQKCEDIEKAYAHVVSLPVRSPDISLLVARMLKLLVPDERQNRRGPIRFDWAPHV